MTISYLSLLWSLAWYIPYSRTSKSVYGVLCLLGWVVFFGWCGWVIWGTR